MPPKLAWADVAGTTRGTLTDRSRCRLWVSAGPIAQILSAEGQPIGEGGKALAHAFPRFAADLLWWVEAAKTQRAKKAPPY
jgi:hypothetical protein